MTWACVMFLSLQLNRINIVNVLTTDFLTDLGMQQNDYNLGQTIYFFSFLVMEIPTQIMNTIVGPTIWIPVSCQVLVYRDVEINTCHRL